MSGHPRNRAVFVVHFTPEGKIAAVTRPGGSLGLPGGKLEPGEFMLPGVLREAREEGWEFYEFEDETIEALAGSVASVPRADVIHRAIIGDTEVRWVFFSALRWFCRERRPRYEDRIRGIGPREVTVAELLANCPAEFREDQAIAIHKLTGGRMTQCDR